LYFWGEQAGMVCAIFAFLGHCFPVWLNFKGGKGVAVMIGSLLALAWPVGVIFCGVWLVIALARKMSSLAALTAAATAPIFAYVVANEWLAATAALLAILLFYQHRANIIRLLNNTEPRIGSENKAPKA
ncbi:MAG TPA: glycerol-3-phosphate acyltransferase, partial [Devosia sp.]|nr:glycerol-3-phosphate acyltransferase [Devosia sp.]